MRDEQYDGMISAIHSIRDQLILLEENQNIHSKWQRETAETAFFLKSDSGWDLAWNIATAVWLWAPLVIFLIMAVLFVLGMFN
jgi:hypothetical protein